MKFLTQSLIKSSKFGIDIFDGLETMCFLSWMTVSNDKVAPTCDSEIIIGVLRLQLQDFFSFTLCCGIGTWNVGGSQHTQSGG